MNKVFHDNAWQDYIFWQSQDKRTLKKINQLLQDIERNGNIGIGKQEALKGDLQGYYSRHIDDKNRLIYRIQEERIEILQCRSHYGDK